MADDQSAQSSNSSVSQFLSTLIPTLVISVVFLLAFIAIRAKQKRVYEPRAIVKSLPQDLRPEPSPGGTLGWLTALLRKPSSFLIQYASTDGYFFLRFLFEFFCICVLGAIITWPILFPVNATNGKNNQPGSNVKGFDILTFSNIRNKWRTFAHVFLSWILFGAVIFLIYRELVYYITYRHALQTTPLYDSLLSSRTLLLTEINTKYLDDEQLRTYFPTATNIWYARNYKKLEKEVKERGKLAKKYEGTLNKVLTKAVKLRNKCIKKGKPVPEPEDDIDKYLKDGKKRPTHKLKFLIGKKVDTLSYSPEKLGEMNKEIGKQQAEYQTYEQLPAVFIEFPSQLELQKAYQGIPYQPDFKGVRTVINAAPEDIVWENLQLTPMKRRIKNVLANTVLTLMIIFWCIPVAVVGAISNINVLTNKVPFLRFILNMPKVIMGVITGLLPVVALAILMSLVPPFIKWMGKISGRLTVQQIEGYCQSWFFAFQVVNVFLAMALGSSAAAVATQIVQNPGQALQQLSANFPKSVNFYYSYLCLQGLTISSGVLLQIVALILSHILGRLLDGTPRAKWTRWNTLGQPAYSTLYPGFQLLTVIALAYSVIAPLILGFTAIAFILFYFAYIYTFIYVLRPSTVDARGANYVRSMFQLFTGLYLAQLWITAIFVFSKNWACVALEAVIVVVTFASHMWMKRRFLPLVDAVPVSAIRYAAGDSASAYPMQDQGYKEIKREGEQYWEGGNQLGLTPDPKDQVLPDKVPQSPLSGNVRAARRESGRESDSSAVDTKTGPRELFDKNHSPFSDANRQDPEKSPGFVNPVNAAVAAPSKGVSWLTRFFQPKKETFDMIKSILPDCYYNYIEYNEDFIRHAYDDPAVTDEEPHIWIAKDPMGLSEIEKNKALKEGVDVSDENATFDDKGQLIFTGPPPSYEDAIRV
ncbi:putative membrane protein C24H6.13 [Candida viswanathii]|uniref:Putative membrane protein C24H6.13 n=1 Tax=Candida viswanathii TaxID=5486 RepID=A0A367YLD3_9ASCO|nr:putative membrane protein C24H6.13 [Candida viswanathii]